jgi:hypothetical protein
LTSLKRITGYISATYRYIYLPSYLSTLNASSLKVYISYSRCL